MKKMNNTSFFFIKELFLKEKVLKKNFQKDEDKMNQKILQKELKDVERRLKDRLLIVEIHAMVTYL